MKLYYCLLMPLFAVTTYYLSSVRLPLHQNTEALSAPSGLRVITATQTTVTLAWDPSSDNQGVMGYRLYENIRSNQFYSSWSLRVDQITGQSIRVSGLKPGSVHKYAVAALDAGGNESAKSRTVKVTTFQPPVTYYADTIAREPVYATAGKLFTYQMAAISEPPPIFELIAGPVGMQVNPISGLVQWVPPPTYVGAVTVTIRATNSQGSDDYTFNFSVYPTQTDLESPGLVQNIAIRHITRTGGTLTWSPATDNTSVAGYHILAQSYGRGQSLLLVGSSVGTQTTYTITNLVPETRYRVWVAAYDAAGNVASISGVPPAYLYTRDNRGPF